MNRIAPSPVAARRPSAVDAKLDQNADAQSAAGEEVQRSGSSPTGSGSSPAGSDSPCGNLPEDSTESTAGDSAGSKPKQKQGLLGIFSRLMGNSNKKQAVQNTFSDDMPEEIRRSSISTQLAWEWAAPRDRIVNRPEPPTVFTTELFSKFKCVVCGEHLRYPVQLEECGHHCCSSCLPSLIEEDSVCPLDQVAVNPERLFVNKALQREIDLLPINCSCSQCDWSGVFRELVIHLEEDCEYMEMTCPRQCGTQLERRLMVQHLTEECARRDIECDFCRETITLDEEIEHLNVCERFPIPCPNECKKKNIPRDEMPYHLNEVCPKQQIPCPFASAGCQVKALRSAMAAHIQQEFGRHLTQLCQRTATYNRTLARQAEVLQTQRDVLQELEGSVDALEKLYGSQLLWKIENFKEKYHEAKFGKKQTIYSPPFMTGKHGYKMALSAALFGDGKARGKYMSVFCCLCRGEYDALLSWPFSHRITFTLIDQCDEPERRQNLSYQISPTQSGNTRGVLCRPATERNASFGAQKFALLQDVRSLSYILSDTIYIKVNIDSETIPAI